jgi:hypothetical protein
MGVVAVVISLRPGMKAVEKTAWLIVTFWLLLTELTAIKCDRAVHDQDVNQARNAETEHFRGIAKGITDAIYQSQNQFDATMARSDEIMKNSDKTINLSRQAIGEVTGGDSFCYFLLLPMGGSRFLITVVPKGEFPLHSVNAVLYDQQKFDDATKGKPLTFDTMLYPSQPYNTDFPIGELSKASTHLGRSLKEYDADDTTDYHAFNVFFSALNGGWNQLIRMRRVDGRWTQATRVITSTAKDFYKEKVLFEHIDPNFPVRRGKIDWLH